MVAEDAGTTVVAGTKKTELKYTALPARTYQVVSPEDADRNRACRFFDITVEEEEAEEALVFRIDQDEQGEILVPLEDDKEYEIVVDVYNTLMEEEGLNFDEE